MSELRSAMLSNVEVVLLKPEIDTRYTRKALATSHDGKKMDALLVKDLFEDHPMIPDSVQLIGIDEGQFLPGLLEFCLRWNKRGVDVVVAALNCDFEKKDWLHLLPLYPHAHIVQCSGVCIACKGKSRFSRKISGDMTKQTEVGGDGMYVAVCPSCYEKDIPQECIEQRGKVVKKIVSMN